MKNQLALIVVLSASMSACGWVDSTGLQAPNANAYADPRLALLSDGDAFAINEQTKRTAVFNDTNNTLQNWSWQLQDSQANIETCLKFEGFKREHITNALDRACSSANDCSLEVIESSEMATTRFEFVVPQLKASAALAYTASSTDASGNIIRKNHTLCALSINEAPTLENDSYVVSENNVLIVDSTDQNSLLANDYDDDDIRNMPLKVNTTPIIAPEYAEEFVLNNNGSFYYKPSSNAPLSNGNTLQDSFVYAVSDGLHTVEARAQIDIVEFNTKPTRIAPLLNLALHVKNNNAPYQLLNLNHYFQDADGDELTYRVGTSDLPTSGNLIVTEQGSLLGQIDSGDIGRYKVFVTASDGSASATGQFTINITQFYEQNGIPAVSDIKNVTVRNTFNYDVSVYFSDIDEDVLSYSAENLPTGVSISDEGVISGTATQDNDGTWLVRVTASDGRGGKTRDSFRLKIR